MKQYLMILFGGMLLFVFFGDALAGRLNSISGGVSGSSYEKIKQLKMISMGAGGLFIMMSLGMFAMRKKMVMPGVAPIIVLVIGLALVAVKFVL